MIRTVAATIALCFACLAAVLAGVAPDALAQTPPAASQVRTAPPVLTVADLRARFADKQSRYASIGGIEIHYKDEGKGPAVLLVHGSISSLKTWDGVANHLIKQHYRVIRYDVPGFGLSDSVTDEALKTLKPVDIAEQLLTRLGVAKVTVVGVSSGGTLGVQLAAKRPDMVDRLILSNAPSDPLSWSPPTDPATLPPAYRAAMEEQKRLGYRTMAFWDAWFNYYSGVPGRFDHAFQQQIYYMMLRTTDKNVTGMIAQVANHEAAVKAMNEVRAPTLLLWGGADPLLPFAAMDKLDSYLINAKVSKLKLTDVGHYPPMEVPRRYAKLVQSYIENVVP